MTKKRLPYTVRVSYSLPQSNMADTQIYRIVGNVPAAGGICLGMGLRDLEFDFSVLESASKAALRLRIQDSELIVSVTDGINDTGL